MRETHVATRQPALVVPRAGNAYCKCIARRVVVFHEVWVVGYFEFDWLLAL
jgi:hypothetical protein